MRNVVQMVEHTVRDREVRGSSPLIPTDTPSPPMAGMPPRFAGGVCVAPPRSRIHPALRDEGGSERIELGCRDLSHMDPGSSPG